MDETDTPKPPISVVFGTPTLDSRVSLEFLHSMLSTTWLLMQEAIPHGYINRGGDCFVAKVRSKIAAEFLSDYPDATDFFFLDDDIGWPAEKVLEFLRRPEDVVAGIYPKKQDKEDWPVQLAADADKRELIERDGLFLAYMAPTGFMRIKRRVLERVAEVAPRFHDQETDGTKEWPMMFCTGIGPDGFFWGEDYSFSRLVAQLGFEIWVDPDINFSHRGHKVWKGNIKTAMPKFRKMVKSSKLKVVGMEAKESAA